MNIWLNVTIALIAVDVIVFYLIFVKFIEFTTYVKLLQDAAKKEGWDLFYRILKNYDNDSDREKYVNSVAGSLSVSGRRLSHFEAGMLDAVQHFRDDSGNPSY